MTVPMTIADVFAASGPKTQPAAPLLANGYDGSVFPKSTDHNYLFNELGLNIVNIYSLLGGAANNNFAPLSSGSAANFIVAYPSPYTVISAGRVLFWRPDRNHSGAATLQVDSLPAGAIKTPDETGALTDDNNFVENDAVVVAWDGSQYVVSDFTPMTSAGGVLTSITSPDGSITVDLTDPSIPTLVAGPVVLRTDVKQTYTRPKTQPFTDMGASNAIDASVSSKVYKQLTTNATITIALGGLEDGQVVEMLFEQDATGGHAVTFGSNFQIADNRPSAANVVTSAGAVSALYGEFSSALNKVVLV